MLGSFRMKLTQVFLPEVSRRYSPCQCIKMIKVLKFTNILKILKVRMMRVLEIGNRPSAINCTTESSFRETRNSTSTSENAVTKRTQKRGGNLGGRSSLRV